MKFLELTLQRKTDGLSSFVSQMDYKSDASLQYTSAALGFTFGFQTLEIFVQFKIPFVFVAVDLKGFHVMYNLKERYGLFYKFLFKYRTHL